MENKYRIKIKNKECKILYEIENSFERGIKSLYYFKDDDVYAIAHWYWGSVGVECVFSKGIILYSE